MKPYIRIAIAAAAFICMVCSCAYAQFETKDSSPLGIRMTDFRPSGSVLKGMSGNWFTPALDYNFRFDSQDRPTCVASLSLFNLDAGGKQARFIPLTVTVIKHFAKEAGQSGWYAGAGLGLYNFRFTDWYNYSRLSTSKKTIGVNLTAGYEFSEIMYAELRFEKIGSVYHLGDGTVDFDGLTFSIGTRMAY